uniref:Uncharacterized protein n=1 Tax=Arundo donax TaxID=35708 RepID=A0A0A8XZY3_ARUDO
MTLQLHATPCYLILLHGQLMQRFRTKYLPHLKFT